MCLFWWSYRRGLSKFYQGKSQSFTSLAKVESLEDLAKAENPQNKRLKSCKSYGGGLSPSAMSRHVSKRGSCFSSMSARRSSGNFMGSRPPIPPHRSTSTTTIPNQRVLFAWEGSFDFKFFVELSFSFIICGVSCDLD